MSSHTLYLTSLHYEQLNLASRKLGLSKSTIINQLISRFLDMKNKDKRNEVLSSDSYGYFSSHSNKVRTTWNIQSTFYKGIDKICDKYKLSVSDFVHRVLCKYSWLFLEQYELSLYKTFNKVYEKNPKKLRFKYWYSYAK